MGWAQTDSKERTNSFKPAIFYFQKLQGDPSQIRYCATGDHIFLYCLSSLQEIVLKTSDNENMSHYAINQNSSYVSSIIS
jgi:hypothetical protein